jgi:pimeloyl-ACP methyl ester carboxylesterase
MPEVELAAGTIEYQDTGGDGPVLVFLHGLTMDGSLWRKVAPGLVADYRCVLPTLPPVGHRRPMRPGADLSLRGMGLLVGEFIERLAAMLRLLGLRAVRRAPGSWGWMSKRPVADEVMDAWFHPATTRPPAVRRDLTRYVTSVPSRPVLLEWAGRSATFGRPMLVVWAAEDRMMPRRHGRRLAGLFPDARLIEIDDSYTLIPEDQPEQLIRAIRDFVPAPRRNTPLPDNDPIGSAPREDRGSLEARGKHLIRRRPWFPGNTSSRTRSAVSRSRSGGRPRTPAAPCWSGSFCSRPGDGCPAAMPTPSRRKSSPSSPDR